MGFFSGKPKIQGDEVRECLSYYEEELKLKLFQEKEGDLFRKTLTLIEWGRPISRDSPAGKEITQACDRLAQAASEILKQRSKMASVPDAAAGMYSAWQAAYQDYAAWADLQAAVFEGWWSGTIPPDVQELIKDSTGPGFAKLDERLEGLRSQSAKSRRRAEEEEKNFLKRLGLSRSEKYKMLVNASAALSAENWQPKAVRDDFVQAAWDLFLENISKYAENQFEYGQWYAWERGAIALFAGLKDIPKFRVTPDSLDKAKLLLELGIQAIISFWYHNLKSQQGWSDEEKEMAMMIALENVQTFLGISSEDSIKLYLGFGKELQRVLNRERGWIGYYTDMFYQRFRECITGEQIVDWGRLQFPIESQMELMNACYKGKYYGFGPEESLSAWASLVSASIIMFDEFRGLQEKE